MQDQPTSSVIPDNLDFDQYTASNSDYISDASEHASDDLEGNFAGRVTAQWRADSFLQQSIGGGAILGDLVTEDGLTDVVSPELVESFESLMGEEVNSYGEARDILAEKMVGESREGFLYKLQGQIGENRFVEQMAENGVDARLADLGNQQGYDVVVTSADGTERFVQVKTYSDASDAIGAIKDTQGSLQSGEITTPEGTVVEEIEYAVPSNIAADVQDGLSDSGINTELHPLQITAEEAAGVVEGGAEVASVLSPEAFEHFLGELAGAGGTSVVFHGAAEAFLVYKGAKEAMDLSGVAKEATITTAAVGVGMGVESLLAQSSLVGGPAGFGITLATTLLARSVFNGIAERGAFARWVKAQGQYTDKLADEVRGLGYAKSPVALQQ